MTLAHGTDRIESERLLLRRITHEDLAFFTRIHAIPDVARYLGHGRPRSAEESSDWLQTLLGTYEDFGLGQLAVVRKSDGVLLGRCGVSDMVVEVTAGADAIPRAWFQRSLVPPGTQLTFEQELGYTFDPAHWGNGYATEAVRCASEYVRAVRKLPRVVSIIYPANVRSLRVAQKFGLQRDGSVEVMEQRADRYRWPAPT